LNSLGHTLKWRTSEKPIPEVHDGTGAVAETGGHQGEEKSPDQPTVLRLESVALLR